MYTKVTSCVQRWGEGRNSELGANVPPKHVHVGGGRAITLGNKQLLSWPQPAEPPTNRNNKIGYFYFFYFLRDVLYYERIIATRHRT